MKTWRCKHCEHINKTDDISCEICENRRPYLKSLNYELTDVFGEIKLSWNTENTDKVKFIKQKKKYDVDVNGSYLLDSCTNKEKIIFVLQNAITEHNEELVVLLGKPNITLFNLEKTKLLSGSSSRIHWNVNNATKIEISELGEVESNGIIDITIKKSPVSIRAKNEIGKVERSIDVEFVPSPLIEFRSEQQQIENGNDTKLIWNVENVLNVVFFYDESKEEISFAGERKVSPKEDTTFKLIATALDGTTIIEKELTIQVFKKPKINFFKAEPDVVLDCNPVTFSWSVENAKRVEIDNGIGEVEPNGSKKSALDKKHMFFTLTAYGELSNCAQEVGVRIFPTPIIESLKVPMPDFESRINLNPIKITSPKIDVSINLPQFTKPNVDLEKIKPKYKPKVSIFNFLKIYEQIRRKNRV